MLCHVQGGYVVNIKWKITEIKCSMMSLHCNWESTVRAILDTEAGHGEDTGKYFTSSFHASTFVLNTAVV